MDWTHSSSLKRKGRKKRAHFGKSTSEPNLSGHFTPRFPDNLSYLLHEYVSVDELKFYRKRRPPNIDDEFHSKDSICLYDKSQPITPFANLKSEYTKEFGKIYSPRSRSVPHKFDLNATTKELLDALRDDFIPDRPRRAKTAKISGEIEIDGVNGILSKQVAKDQPISEKDKKDAPKSVDASQKEGSRKCMLKVQGEVSYSPNNYSGEFKGQSTMDNWQPNSQLNNITFYGKFHSKPEYNDSFKAYNHFTKSAPIKARDHLRVNTAIVAPNLATLSEYTDKFKELNLKSVDKNSDIYKRTGSVAMRNKLMIGHSDAHVFPEYFESFKDPLIKKPPEKGKPHSPVLGLSGNMDYDPEYRVKFTDFPRRRPVTQRPESHFDFFERPTKSSPVHHAIIAPKFNPNPHVAVVEPTRPNVPPTIDKNPFYVCQPEVRKARREILIKKRPTSPSQTIAAAVKSTGHIFPTDDNEDEENRRYNERSRIIMSSPVKAPVEVTIENFDEPSSVPKTIIRSGTPMKPGRRMSVTADVNGNSYIKRNLTKIVEGNSEYAPKKKSSLTSSTTDDEFANASKQLVSSQSLEAPSFVILKDPIKQNKWMKSSWYL